MKKYPKTFSTIFLSVLGVTLFSSVSFFPTPVAAAPTPSCTDRNQCTIANNISQACQKDSGACSEEERLMLQNMAKCDASTSAKIGDFLSSVTGSKPSVTFPCTDSQKADAAIALTILSGMKYGGGAIPKAPSACSLNPIWGGGFDFTECFWNPLIAGIGALLIFVSALFLALADLLFNWSVDNTILLFSTEVFAKVEGGVNAGWTAMRDIANIVIIGMFTFIAISTILSIKEYGAEKMIARVLIIAVLINFSLLFTKIIIDVSNFTASQFYASSFGYTSISNAQTAATERSTGKNKPGNTIQDSSLTSFQSKGIAGAFIGFLGVTSVSSSYDALNRLANNPSGGWYIAFAHGLLAFVLLGAAGCVLLYGAYLLISRAVLFIFLMVTAAGAFATHLIPKMNEGTYGWNGWWSSLLHNAALAPFLMIFLWITIKVSSTLTKQQGGLLGNLVTDAPASTDVGALFSYFIILGLLWGSFLLASKWAGKVGGLGFTGTILSSATVGTAALASRFIAAPILRQTAGKVAYDKQQSLNKEAKQARTLSGQAQREMIYHSRPGGDKVLAERARQEMEKQKVIAANKTARAGFAGKIADSRFNVMDIAGTAPVKKVTEAIGKATGAKIYMTGESSKETKSFAGDIKAKAEAATKAEGLTVSEDEKFEIRERAMKQLREQRKIGRATVDAIRDSARMNTEAVQQLAQNEKRRLVPQQQAAKSDVSREKTVLGEMLERHQSTISQINTSILDPRTNPTDIPALQEKLKSTEAVQNSEMRTQQHKIEQATEKVKKIEDEMANTDKKEFTITTPDGTPLETSVSKAREALQQSVNDVEEFDRQTEEEVRDAGRLMVEAVQDAAQEAGAELARKEVNILRRMVTSDDTRVSDAFRKKFRHKVRTATIKSALEDYLKEDGGGGAKTEAKETGPAGLPPTH